MPKDKRSIFERLTGNTQVAETYADEEVFADLAVAKSIKIEPPQEAEEGQLTVDVFQTPDAIIIQSTVAGVKPEDLDVSITQEMVTIQGVRRTAYDATGDDYYFRELYWGKFSRTIVLPQEVDDEEAEATIKNGLLTIKLPKKDKNRVQKVKVKTE
jgi:HSP20 family protein